MPAERQPGTPQFEALPDLYRTVLEALQDGVCFAGLDGRITFWNRGAEEISGYLSQDMLGRKCSEDLLAHCCGDGAPLCRAACPMKTALAGGESDLHATMRHREGHRIPVRVITRPVRDTAGVVAGTVQIFDRWSYSGQVRRRRPLEQHGCLDSLTGALSRHYAETKLGEFFGELDAWGIPFGVLRLDLDGFGDFNHRYGEAAGDALLRALARTIAYGVRREDVLARWSGDEFLVLIRDCPVGALARIGERIRALIAGSGVFWWGSWINATVSAGGAAARCPESAEGVLERAAEQLDASRAAGGDTVRVVDG